MKFKIYKISCSACCAKIEKAVRSIDTVSNVTVNPLLHEMEVLSPNDIHEEVINKVRSIGYDALYLDDTNKDCETPNDEENLEQKKLLQRLCLSILLLIPIMYLSLSLMFLPPIFSYTITSILLALLTVVISLINYQFFYNGLRALSRFAPNMDSLVALGALSAFLYSLCALLENLGLFDIFTQELHYYFESTAMILTLITLGRYLESRAKQKSTLALTNLYTLLPKTALISKEGKLITITADKLKVGDTFLVKQGAAIPTDAKVIKGVGIVDESMITGEAALQNKETDDLVFGASILVEGLLTCEVTKAITQSTYAQIIEIVKNTTLTKAPIARVADIVCGYFVPFIILIALLTLIGHLLVGDSAELAILSMVSVLLISCPCALGLATPISIMCGTSIAAKHNILFKTAASMETLSKVNAIIFDKTGTITIGKPELCEVTLYSNAYEELQILTIAQSLELLSSHPLSIPFKEINTSSYAKKHNITITDTFNISDFKTIKGKGLSGIYNNAHILLGSLTFLQEEGANITHDFDKTLANNLDYLTQTYVFMAIDKKLVASFKVSDSLKHNVLETFKELKNLGLKLYLLTGAKISDTSNLALKLNLDQIIPNALPQDKASFIKKLQEQNLMKVAFIGDGINDAPALAQSDIAISLKGASDIAQESADILLMHQDLYDIVRAYKISNSTLRNIKENLFWAFIYNTISIPLATGAFSTYLGFSFSPVIGAFAMSLSSVCVISNALRLYKINLSKELPSKDNTCQITLPTRNNEMIRIEITGMMCQHCENHVTKALTQLGLNVIEIDHEKNYALCDSKDVKVNEELFTTIKNAIEQLGYNVIAITKE